MAIENAGELTFSRPLSAVSPVGDAYDNAPCDSFFATLECELIRRRSFRTQSEARRAVFRFIETGTIPIGGIQALATSPRPTSKPGHERRRREDRAMSGPPASAALFHPPIDGAETLDLSEWTSSEKSTTLNWPPKRGSPHEFKCTKTSPHHEVDAHSHEGGVARYDGPPSHLGQRAVSAREPLCPFESNFEPAKDPRSLGRSASEVSQLIARTRPLTSLAVPWIPSKKRDTNGDNTFY